MAGHERGRRSQCDPAGRSTLPPRVCLARGDSIGLLADGQGRSIVHTLNLRAVARRALGRGFTFRFATGANYTGQSTADVAARQGYEPIIGMTSQSHAWEDRATFGWFLEPALDNPRLLALLRPAVRRREHLRQPREVADVPQARLLLYATSRSSRSKTRSPRSGCGSRMAGRADSRGPPTGSAV